MRDGFVMGRYKGPFEREGRYSNPYMIPILNTEGCPELLRRKVKEYRRDQTMFYQYYGNNQNAILAKQGSITTNEHQLSVILRSKPALLVTDEPSLVIVDT